MQKTTPYLLRVIRLIQLMGHVFSGFLQSFVYAWVSLATKRRMMQRWACGLLSILNIKLHCQGNLPTWQDPRVLLVANHVSWLDICVLMAVCPTRFVAKSEISRWPVLGRLSRNVGTLFIQRAKRSDTARINQQISAVLEMGERVVVFPEGTTSEGTQLNHFHASLLQSAVTADALLYPIALRYRNTNGTLCSEAAYLDSSLLLSLKKILSQPCINAEIMVSDPILCGLKNRRELARMAEQAIADALSLPVMHRSSEIPFDPPDE